MIVMSYRPLLVTRRSCIVPTALDSLSFAAVLCVNFKKVGYGKPENSFEFNAQQYCYCNGNYPWNCLSISNRSVGTLGSNNNLGSLLPIN
ncbi:hypothetical protein QWZ13_11780 [Reinekea marina]|uniref:hypothetical protein n=1 Tax=Reinekea marina TaxID=1310421 RepID=UPI0025B33EBC|nr:hypothetical protein [Reinekea marina]MDN3649596.1 hypothetical protein [Reinekea marina]